MPDIKTAEAKKDLQGLVDKQKQANQKNKEALLPEAERQALADKQKKEQEDAAVKKTQAEEQQKKNADILAKKEEELSEIEKKHKETLLDAERKKESDRIAKEDSKLSADEKIKRVKEESQKRIDTITNQIKLLEDKNSREADELRKEMENLRSENDELSKQVSEPEKKRDVNSIVNELEQKAIGKYLDDDKALPIEQRREITKTELDEWLVEDIGSAQAWLTRREVRRDREREGAKRYLGFQGKQQESLKKFERKHPEFNVRARREELSKEGKTPEQVEETIRNENEKYKLASDIAIEHPEWGNKHDAPELVMAELEKRLDSKTEDAKTEEIKTKEQEEIAALKTQNEELDARLQAMENSDVGINSTGRRSAPTNGKLTDAEEMLVSTLKSLKTPESNIQSALKKFRENPTYTSQARDNPNARPTK